MRIDSGSLVFDLRLVGAFFFSGFTPDAFSSASAASFASRNALRLTTLRAISVHPGESSAGGLSRAGQEANVAVALEQETARTAPPKRQSPPPPARRAVGITNSAGDAARDCLERLQRQRQDQLWRAASARLAGLPRRQQQRQARLNL